MIRIFIGMLLIFTSSVSFAASGSIPLKPVLIDLNNLNIYNPQMSIKDVVVLD